MLPPLPPKQTWKGTLLAIDKLVRRRVFRTADLAEFADVTGEVVQQWCKRELLKDPAKGQGHPREFALHELGPLVLGRHFGQRIMARTLEAAFHAGTHISAHCIRRWLETANARQAELGADPRPLTAFATMLTEMTEGSPDFLVLTARGVVRPAPPECSLGDIWTVTHEAVFTALDIRTAVFGYFAPMVIRLAQRVEAAALRPEELESVDALQAVYDQCMTDLAAQAAEIQAAEAKGTHELVS